MVKLFLLFLCCGFLISCRDTLELVDQKGSSLLRGKAAEIGTAHEGEWKVGKNRLKKVSKSVSMSIETPVLKKEDALVLSKKYGINAWIFRVRRLGKGQEEIGHFYIQFITDTGRPEFVPVSRTMVEIFYAASFASERFRHFSCPAFGHRKKITRYSIEANGVSSFSSQTFPKNLLNSQSELSFVNPAKLNGGNSLVGVYEIDVALYNSHSKEYFGQFSSIKNRLVVESEEEVDLPECAGVLEENDAPSSSKSKFHFGH